MSCRILPLLGVLVLTSSLHSAGDNTIDRATLKGVKAVAVVTDTIDPQVEQLGVTRQALIDAMLKRLQAGGIAIDPTASEFLGLRLTAVRGGRGPFAISLDIGFYQPVILSRDKQLRTSTQTWEVETVVLADPKVLLNACTETAGDLAEHFVTAFRAANPR